jgi:aspartate--ammonia ligase
MKQRVTSLEGIPISACIIPTGYKAVLPSYETQTAIGRLRRAFEDKLRAALNLRRVSAPLFVEASTGFNDDLSGVEQAVSFDMPAAGKNAQIVHSLAKWKRVALHKYGFRVGKGMYTDMNAIRRDEPDMDNIHSFYADQWDWEKVITKEDRNLEFLRETVRTIVGAMCDTQDAIHKRYPALSTFFNREVTFISAQELEDMYPALSPSQREQEFTRLYKTVCVTQIGGKLRSGERHGHRAPDYDDWSLNGDIILWSDVLQTAVEISSMGIRVDEAALDRQLTESGHDQRRTLLFHRMLLGGELPLTIGGGIGQSRLCMLILEKAHIGEVQVSVWDDETVRICSDAGVELL